MTVRAVTEAGNRISGSDIDKSMEFSSPELSMNAGKLSGVGKVSDRRVSEKKKKSKSEKVCGEVETGQESGGSSEEFEPSPKSVTKVGLWSENIAYVHSQIARIREEDSHLGEDIGEGLNAKDKIGFGHHMASQMNVLLFSKPILPSSPLSGKTPIKTLH